MFPDITRDDVFMLETPRLWLRWPRAADARAVMRLAGDRAVAEMTVRIPHPYPPEEAERFIFRSREANAAGAGLVLAVALKNRPSELVGVVSAEKGREGEAMIGYWIGKPFQGRGLGTEAVETLLRAVFTLSSADAAAASVRAYNAASRRVLEKLGFVAASGDAGVAASFERFRLDRADWTVADVRIDRSFDAYAPR